MEVKPECAKKDPKSYNGLMDHWWQFWRIRSELMAALSGLDRCIALTLHSKAVMPVMVPSKQVFSHALGVFASDDYALLSFLSSGPHYWWAVDRGSSLETRVRYTPTDVFETLVRPNLTQELRDHGLALENHRRGLMADRHLGLTATYNLVHDLSCHDDDIVKLRAVHRAIDEATARAYGWEDLLEAPGGLDHGFHETAQGTRYTIGLAVRTEIIDRLRELNHERYAAEVAAGLHKGKSGSRGKRAQGTAGKAQREEIPSTEEDDPAQGFGDNGLFPPQDALF